MESVEARKYLFVSVNRLKAFDRPVRDGGLGKIAVEVLQYMIEEMQSENDGDTVIGIARMLGLQVSQSRAAVDRLVSAGALTCDGTYPTYRVMPEIAYFGSESHRQELRKEAALRDRMKAANMKVAS